MTTEERLSEAEPYPGDAPCDHCMDTHCMSSWARNRLTELRAELDATRAERDAALEALAVCGRAGCPTAADFAGSEVWKEAYTCADQMFEILYPKPKGFEPE